MSGILEIVNAEIPELEAVPDGEYKVEITNVEEKMDRNQRPGYRVTLRVVDKPNTKRITHWVSMPVEGDDEDKANAKGRQVQAFAKAFKIKSDDPKEWEGLVADVALVLENSAEYGDQNRVKRFIVGK